MQPAGTWIKQQQRKGGDPKLTHASGGGRIVWSSGLCMPLTSLASSLLHAMPGQDVQGDQAAKPWVQSPEGKLAGQVCKKVSPSCSQPHQAGRPPRYSPADDRNPVSALTAARASFAIALPTINRATHCGCSSPCHSPHPSSCCCPAPSPCSNHSFCSRSRSHSHKSSCCCSALDGLSSSCCCCCCCRPPVRPGGALRSCGLCLLSATTADEPECT